MVLFFLLFFLFRNSILWLAPIATTPTKLGTGSSTPVFNVLNQELMETIKLQDYCAEQGFVQIAKVVRANVNGYVFITFIRADNTAENIYVSKAGSASITVGQAVDKALLRPLSIAITKNAAGETRVKLCTNSERIDLADLWD